MRKLITIWLLVVVIACNPDGLGCFQPGGKVETISIDVVDFTEIDVRGNINLKLSSGPGEGLLLTTGRNLVPGIRIEVVDGVLYLDNLNTCDWSRKYLNPVVEISNNALTSIYHQGYGYVESIDTLSYDQLKIENDKGTADFNLSVNIGNLEIISNEVANFYISGDVDQLTVGFYYNDGIFYGQELQTVSAGITHFGSNTIHLNVTDNLFGEINSLGNVIAHKQMPLVVELVEYSTGKFIFKP